MPRLVQIWFVFLVFTAGCHSSITAMPSTGFKFACAAGAASCGAVASGPFAITSRAPLVVGPGASVTLKGSGFRSDMVVSLVSAVDQSPLPASLKVDGPTQASVIMPSSAPYGLLTLTAQEANTAQQVSLFFTGGKLDHPIITADASEICSGLEYYDQAGTLQTGTKQCGAGAAPAPCSADGATNCLATSGFPAAAANGLSDKILSGQTVAGVAGDVTLPPANSVLATISYGIDGVSLSGQIASRGAWDLTSAFPGPGYYTGITNPPAAGTIKSGALVSGVSGTLTVPDPWDLRIGATAGGVTGMLPVNCRNESAPSDFSIGQPQAVTNIDTSTYELTVPAHGFTSGEAVRVLYAAPPTGLSNGNTYYVIYVDVNTIQLSATPSPGLSPIAISSAGSSVSIFAFNVGVANIWSTIDDNLNYTGSGYSFSGPWSAANVCGGVEATPGDANVWKDVTTDAGNNPSTCAATPANCTYQDKISKLSWTKTLSVSSDWASAIIQCQNLTYNNETGWRLPSEKEWMSAYVHGVMTVTNANWISASDAGSYFFWTSSSGSTTDAWNVNPSGGMSGTNNKTTTSFGVACVRP